MARMFSNIVLDARVKPNRWDFIALTLVLGVIVLLAKAASQMAVPYAMGESIPISLDPAMLPTYAVQTVTRMFVAMFFSILATFIFGTWAAKSRRAANIIIPTVDILQAVPVLAFLSLTVVGFIELFPGSILGPECAAVFAIFTSQVWNMIISFYQSLRGIPLDIREAADMLQLSAWQRFWRVEVPFSMPGLLWNSMMSMSGAWFFVVASEAISVANQKITLPGIGSYIALAIEKADTHAVFYAIICMFIVIILYDQLIFRPLIRWSDKFKSEQTPAESITRSWFTRVLQRTHVLRYLGHGFIRISDAMVNTQLFSRKRADHSSEKTYLDCKYWNWIWNSAIAIIATLALALLVRFIFREVSLHEFATVVMLGFITMLRIFILIVLCTLLWVPIGIYIGLRPNLVTIFQPITQILAAFPAYLLFPVVVMIIVKYQLNVEVWTSPLMILGAQWYILFNVIAGASRVPRELILASDNFGLKGWQRWRQLLLPSVLPYYVTGAMTAAGGAWNASIVAEVVPWGNTTLKATGLGAYISQYSTMGDFPHLALGIGVMCLWVLLLTHIIWRPLFNLAESRFRLD